MNAGDLHLYELCPRRLKWSQLYPGRISPLSALHQSITKGLEGDGENDAKNHLMTLAANPGLDVEGQDVYSIAVHFASLAAILCAYLKPSGPWKRVETVRLSDVQSWTSECFELPDGRIRRIVLVDHWSDERKESEIRGWRTTGEMAVLSRPVLLNIIEIGHSVARRRVSPWARAYAHPKNKKIRFKRKNSTAQPFSQTWQTIWRENSDLTTTDWLKQMQADEVFKDLVHAVNVPVHPRIAEFRSDVLRMTEEMEILSVNPAMRRTGCYGWAKCRFVDVCHGAKGDV